MTLQLAIHSSPRFSTWIWIPDWRLLIDACDGVTQHLGYKIRKIDTVAMTHAHRDHLGGLIQVVNQRGESGGFTVAYPCGSASFQQLEAFCLRFNPGTSRNAVWKNLEEGDYIETGIEGRLIKAFRTQHYSDDDGVSTPRSLGYHLIWRKQKLRPRYMHLPQNELDAVRLEVGRAEITQQVDEKWISIGGDGRPLDRHDVEGCQYLLHEATFLDATDYNAEDAGEDVGHIHSTVQDALKLAHDTGLKSLILYHISTRYSDAEIRSAIQQQAQSLQLKATVWAAMPRRVHWDLMAEKPVWDGTTE